MSWDWREEFRLQHGHAPGGSASSPTASATAEKEMAGEDARPPDTEAPTATPAAVEQAAPAKASDLPPVEATGGGGAENPDETGASASLNLERVEIAPNRFVNLAAAEQLGLVRKAGG